jgi:hypothetical protein
VQTSGIGTSSAVGAMWTSAQKVEGDAQQLASGEGDAQTLADATVVQPALYRADARVVTASDQMLGSLLDGYA